MILHIQWPMCARMCVPAFCKQLLIHHQGTVLCTECTEWPDGISQEHMMTEIILTKTH